MQPVVKYTPSQAKQQPQQPKAKTLIIPVGTLAQRKLKVRNIDANNVTVADLQVSEASVVEEALA